MRDRRHGPETYREQGARAERGAGVFAEAGAMAQIGVFEFNLAAMLQGDFPNDGQAEAGAVDSGVQ